MTPEGRQTNELKLICIRCGLVLIYFLDLSLSTTRKLKVEHRFICDDCIQAAHERVLKTFDKTYDAEPIRHSWAWILVIIGGSLIAGAIVNAMGWWP